MRSRRLADLNLWLVLGAGTAALAWLIPDKSGPWRSFPNEWLTAVALFPLAIWVGLQRKSSTSIPSIALGALAVGVIPLMQGLAGQIRFGSDAALAVMYMSGVALAIVVGRAWRAEAPPSAELGLPLTALCAALATLGMALMQWLQVDTLGVMLIALLPNARPTGNIGQANHLATLMAWGLVAIWWLYESRRVNGLVASTTALFLLFGLAMSQSRTGWLHVSVLAVTALTLRCRLKLRVAPVAVVLLVVAFTATVIGWERLNSGLQMAAALTIEQQATAGSRLRIWQLFAHAVLLSPWLGYGWTQAGLAQQAVLLDLAPINLVLGHAHNLVLDLLVWQGVPLTLATLGAFSIWMWRRVQRIQTLAAAMCTLALLLLLLHSMLEFPHQYAYFLLPAALLLGVIEADTGDKPRMWTSSAAWLGVVAASGAVLLWLAVEYMTIGNSLQRYRFETARVGSERGSLAPDVHLLGQLGALMAFIRTDPELHLDDARMAAAERVVARFPSGSNQFRLAMLLANNSRPQDASRVLRQLCAMQPHPNCENAVAAWHALAERRASLRAVGMPTVAQ